MNSGVKYFAYPGTELGLEYQIYDHDKELTGIAFLVVGVYYILLMGSEAISLQGFPVIAMWIPNIILGTIGIILTYKVCAS